jgi:exodeoxyribonuclease I
MSFVFFDTETTGLRRGFDQIIHFAAIKTDNDLVEIDRFETRCRLLPFVVPNPSALTTNGITIERLNDKRLASHYAMVAEIQRTLVNWSPSIFVGYNSIRFDEEMLRHALFQTLRPAFLTSNPRNGRADALSLMMAASALSPTAITVPREANGRATFRLGAMAAANNVAHGQAHEAMNDAMATLELCRIVRERSSDVWQRFVRFSYKASVRDFVDSGDGFVLTEFFSGNAYHAPVICIGNDPGNPNGRLCLSLGSDVEALVAASDDELETALACKPSPIRWLRTNAAPTITTLFDATEEMVGGTTVEQLETLARRVRNDEALCLRIITSYVVNRPSRRTSSYVEGRIYDGVFPGPDDERRMRDFHDASWRDAYAIVQRFQDDRLRAFGLRLIYLGDRAVLPGDVRRSVETEMTSRLLDDGPEGYSLQRALRETEDLLVGNSTNGVLAGYRAYLVDRIERVRKFQETLNISATQ